MDRLGRSWLTEDDGWYANLSWNAPTFPIAGVDDVAMFLRPWRDPSSGPRLAAAARTTATVRVLDPNIWICLLGE